MEKFTRIGELLKKNDIQLMYHNHDFEFKKIDGVAILVPHLNEIDRIARERLKSILPDLMKSAGVTEELKQKDQLKWVGLANACKAQAEEIIFDEIIFS